MSVDKKVTMSLEEYDELVSFKENKHVGIVFFRNNYMYEYIYTDEDMANKINDLQNQISDLKERGFWSRLFNRNE